MRYETKINIMFVVIFITIVGSLKAQNISAAFYNVQNLFDTIDSPLIYDSDFTPQGRYEWDSERYEAKVAAIARVVGDLGVDVIALAEVENEQVVRDLVRTTKVDYAYFHYNSSDSRGIDIAMLYRPERFFIDSTQVFEIKGHRRQIITLYGSVGDRQVIFSACHLPSAFSNKQKRFETAQRAGSYFRALTLDNPRAACIIVGDFNFTAESNNMKAILSDDSALVSASFKNHGMGTYIYGDKKFVYDNILLSRNIESKSLARIFVKDYLLDNSPSGSATIKPTYSGGVYHGGTSDHLPVMVIIED